MPASIDLNKTVSVLKNFYKEKKRLPSFSEIQTLFKYRSKSAASFLVDKLIEKGVIEKDQQGRIVPTSAITGAAKVLGTVQAGFPSPAEEELLDTLSLDEFLIRKPNATYLVKVSGDSMIDEGIKEGDLVLVERGRQPQPGDIVIAQVDGQWTMKYFETKHGKVRLLAANKKYPPIEPQNELVIGGVVIGNVRKYK